MVRSIKLANVSEASKLFLLAAIGGGLFWLLLSYMGFVGMSVAGVEALLWLVLGIFLLSETVLEDASALKKLDVIVTLELLVAMVVTLFGISIFVGTSAATLTSYMNPYKVYILGAGMIFGFLEVRTKI